MSFPTQSEQLEAELHRFNRSVIKARKHLQNVEDALRTPPSNADDRNALITSYQSAFNNYAEARREALDNFLAQTEDIPMQREGLASKIRNLSWFQECSWPEQSGTAAMELTHEHLKADWQRHLNCEILAEAHYSPVARDWLTDDYKEGLFQACLHSETQRDREIQGSDIDEAGFIPFPEQYVNSCRSYMFYSAKSDMTDRDRNSGYERANDAEHLGDLFDDFAESRMTFADLRMRRNLATQVANGDGEPQLSQGWKCIHALIDRANDYEAIHHAIPLSNNPYGRQGWLGDETESITREANALAAIANARNDWFAAYNAEGTEYNRTCVAGVHTTLATAALNRLGAKPTIEDLVTFEQQYLMDDNGELMQDVLTPEDQATFTSMKFLGKHGNSNGTVKLKRVINEIVNRLFDDKADDCDGAKKKIVNRMITKMTTMQDENQRNIRINKWAKDNGQLQQCYRDIWSDFDRKFRAAAEENSGFDLEEFIAQQEFDADELEKVIQLFNS